MNKTLIIGAGGVGKVVAYKCAQLVDVFGEITLASRTVSKCESIAKEVLDRHGVRINTEKLDADNVSETVAIINKYDIDLVINVALPYQDLAIMDACLETNTHYLDTANYEPIDEAKFEYSWQWAYQDRFKEKGLTAILGCGFDPGVTQAFTAYAAKHHFDEMHYLDIVDCNGGDHGKAFATNFNPEINIREITQNGRYYENGKWVEIPPFSIMQQLEYPNIGQRDSYVLYHEELESLVKNFPTIKRARFWMTFGKKYLDFLRMFEEIGLSSIEPINYNGMDIVPLQFLKAILPQPESLGENYTGETSIGCRIKGIKDGEDKTYYIYNNCRHQDAFEDTKSQGVSFTTGVPAMVGAKMVFEGHWKRPGVFNVEEMDPDMFLEDVSKYGLPFHEVVGGDLEMRY